MSHEAQFEVALSFLPYVGDQLTKVLVSYCGSAKAVFDTPVPKLMKVPGVGERVAKSIRDNGRQALLEADEVLKKASDKQVKLLFYTSPHYPNRLKQLPDAPPLLYFRGNSDLNHRRIISIVGTRKPTSYGQGITERIVEDLKPYNVMIVSGLAYGIDIAAHRAALQAGLPTIGVMASGPDTIYPGVHKKYAEKMLEQGGVITENTFGTKPDAPRFPARNRIIAGMSDCTIVIEAAFKSGTLITADIAHSYDKEVMAVPGNINSPMSEGTNWLIKSHKAAVLTSTQDLIELLNWDVEDKLASKRAAAIPALDPADFTAEEMQVLQVLIQSGEEQMDNLGWKSQVPISQLASVLLSLEFKGMVKAMPGKRFALIR
ncbi:DNA-processing protein DprA [Pontibacter ramchanderi]|uniref:DNA processing protein n=1 Tax=Pontibacter ramchanderi TaxID=1179743 RepID=A0A2N3V1I6_9BACT|nr:DNA-processing protein DprA [Pontibacter ramchanderi]PKV75487.1 DNA processing protein [Pontibacter ramchanderi]